MADKAPLVTAQPQYIPVCVAVPVFSSIQPVKGPEGIPDDVWGVLQASNLFTVRQHLKLFPKACCSCPPCVRQENTYSVYAGLTEEAQAEILRIDEVSDDWNRCCCAPYHPVRLEVRPYIPVPGDGTNSDYRHIQQDMQSSWGTLSGQQQATAVRDLYKSYPPVMNFLRYDGARCCCKMPCRCFSCFTCFECCQDGLDVYAGQLEDEPEKERGRPYNLEAHQSQLLASVTKPICGGYYHPLLELREGQGITPQGRQPQTIEPFSKLEGPCFFGGWTEFCCDFYFPLSRYNSGTSAGDLGVVVKKAPTSLAGGFRSVLGDNSVYTIQFQPESGLTATQKSTVLAAQILYDYMLFDGSTEKCSSDDQNIYCYICYCLLFGALFNCRVTIPKNGGGN